MKVLLTGGGSGGHITPVLAVASEIKLENPKVHLQYAIGKNDPLIHLPENDSAIEKVFTIRSGKFRRYHGEGLKQLVDIPTLLKNIRDFFYVCVGIVQAVRMLKKERPDVVFIKGGYVGVPVGLAAAICSIPYITHDSDAVPGLANRIISRWAVKHTVAMPIENYSYDTKKMIQVGVPISDAYRPVSSSKRQYYLKELELPHDAQVLLVTGGGLGAQRLNTAITKIAKPLLTSHANVYILHLTGGSNEVDVRKQYGSILAENDRIRIKPFVDNMYMYTGAADVVVARAGANSLAELAAQQKACIIVPNPQLTGGHQTKNADILEHAQAIKVVSDAQIVKNPESLLREIESLLKDENARTALAESFHKTADISAAEKLARILLDTAKEAKA
jgi:UDP-N-acetylglucosamine--N-acetylmuramyl-(pentapeptide) pyrophosphoryl-undecaprenol N-acetylglucosamine transferase